MKISGNPGNNPVASSAPAAAVRAPAAAAPATGAAPAQGLQSGVLQPALEALREMPDIDQARVAELRDALARGELKFDAGKLAELVTRYHGKRP